MQTINQVWDQAPIPRAIEPMNVQHLLLPDVYMTYTAGVDLICQVLCAVEATKSPSRQSFCLTSPGSRWPGSNSAGYDARGYNAEIFNPPQRPDK